MIPVGALGADFAAPPADPAHVEAAAHKAVFTRESMRRVFCGDEDRVFRSSGIRGSAIFVVHVGTNGRADEVRVFWSSGTPRLDQALAVCLLKKEKFKPATKDGSPVESWEELRYEYKPY